MSKIEALLEDALRRSSERIDPPPRKQALTASRRGRSRRRRRGIATVVGAALLVGGIALPIVWLSPLASERDFASTPAPTASPSTEELSPPPGGPPFHPETYREGAMTVMPVTFPDGSTAELVYPAALELEEGVVSPDGYLSGGRRGCTGNVIASRSNGADDIYVADRPIAVYEGPRGEPVGLWAPTKSWEPYNWLVMRFGSWVVSASCYPFEPYRYFPEGDPGDVAAAANSIDAHETENGFLVFTPRRELELASAPSLRFYFGVRGRDNRIVELTLERCNVDDRSSGDGVVQWCAAAGIRIYALGNAGFLEALAAGLEVRNFQRG